MKEISYEGPEATKEEADWAKKKKPSIGSKKAPTVRTFRADIEELIQEKGTTKSDIMQAEAARRESRGEQRFPVEEDESHFGRLIFILVLVLAFGLGVGIYALVEPKFAIPFLHMATTTPAVETTDDLSIELTDSPREQVLTDIALAFKKTSLPAGKERALVFHVKNSAGDTENASITQLLKATGMSRTYVAFTESVDPDFMYHISQGITLTGVLTFHSPSYANTFGAVFDWEVDMASDLIPILNPEYNRKDIKSLEGRVFRDERIGTVDARILRDVLGNPLIAYGFIDKKTLVIAGSRDGLIASINAAAMNK